MFIYYYFTVKLFHLSITMLTNTLIPTFCIAVQVILQFILNMKGIAGIHLNIIQVTLFIERLPIY